MAQGKQVNPQRASWRVPTLRSAGALDAECLEIIVESVGERLPIGGLWQASPREDHVLHIGADSGEFVEKRKGH